MRPLSIPAGLLAAALAAGAVASACFSDRSDGGDLTSLPTACQELIAGLDLPANSAVVGIENFEFVPASVEVSKGQTVTWVDCESPGTAQHTVTSDQGSAALHSALLSRGQTYSATLSVAGTYGYHCEPHSFMQGKVVVK